MPDEPTGAAELRLLPDFPPVATAEWEAAIRRDLRGADFEATLVWRPEEEVAVRPFYRREDLDTLQTPQDTRPGEVPFLRGGGGRWTIVDSWAPPDGAIRADLLHDAGATAVQELGYAIAAGVDRLAARTDAGRSVDEAARAIEFAFAVGSTYFVEIAKLRAARLLWALAVDAFGPSHESSCLMRLHVRTARANKSRHDTATNLLRATTEALAAAIGGCDTLFVEPFGFDDHLAVNIQRILDEESHVGAAADPGGGSYYIEALTDVLAREAWTLFQRVEAAGGYAKVVEDGTLDRELARSRADKERAVATRRRTLVGVNRYPDTTPRRDGADRPEAVPDGSWRLALPFERIRGRTERHARESGRVPTALLVTRGDPATRTWRANLAADLLGCAGFEIHDSETAAEAPRSDLVVFCAGDDDYPALLAEVSPRVSVPLIVVGRPGTTEGALRDAGVQDFLHEGIDAVRWLEGLQDRLGMRR